MMKVKFGDVVNRVNIKVDRHHTDRIYYVGGEHIESNELMIHDKGLIKGSTIGYKFHFGFNPRHILFMSRNPHLRKCSMVNFSGVCSDSTYVIETKDDSVLLQDYLLFEMQSDRFWKWAEEHKSGGVNYLINYATLSSYEFFLPSLSVQRELSKKLWAAYRLKESYKKLLLATRDMVKSQFIEMFGNPLSSKQKYPLKELGECCEINPTRPQFNIGDDDMVSFVPMQSVSEEGYLCENIEKPYSKVKKGFTYFGDGDVLFAKITPCMENGKGAIAEHLTNGIGMGSTEFHVLRPIPGTSTSQWILALTRMSNFRTQAARFMSGTGGQKRVSASYLENFKIGLPPIDRQEQFAEIFIQASGR